MAFNIDMSPLERSSMSVKNALSGVGQVIGDRLAANKQQAEQKQEQGDIEAFMRQAMSGDPAAFESLMVKSPQAARMVAEHLQNKQATSQGEQEQFKTQMALDTASFVEQMHLAPPEQQEAMFNAAVDDTRFDIDEEDRQYFMDPNARKALIAQVKGDDYAKNFFGKPKEGTKFQQGTGDMSGHVFNPDDGTFNINPELKNKLEAVKANPELSAKDRQSINKDFTQLTKDTKLIRNTAKDLEKLSTIKSGPASIAMVFKFMKALDPTSVVREGEFMTAENSAGVPEALKNTYNKLMEGGRLGPEQIQQFVTTAKSLANSAIESSNSEVGDFIKTFEDTLPKGFIKALLNRIPKAFEVAGSAHDSEIVLEDNKALEWANANPNDPRSAKILSKLKGAQ